MATIKTQILMVMMAGAFCYGQTGYIDGEMVFIDME